MTVFAESVVEDAALAWPEAIGWSVAHGPDIAPDMPAAERRDDGEVGLGTRLRDASALIKFPGPDDFGDRGQPGEPRSMPGTSFGGSSCSASSWWT